VNPLVMMSVLNTSPRRLIAPFAKLNRATTVATIQDSVAERWVIDTAGVTAFFYAAPIEWVVGTFCRHYFASTYWACVVTSFVRADKFL